MSEFSDDMKLEQLPELSEDEEPNVNTPSGRDPTSKNWQSMGVGGIDTIDCGWCEVPRMGRCVGWVGGWVGGLVVGRWDWWVGWVGGWMGEMR